MLNRSFPPGSARGFTLIEVMVVMAIAGVLAAIAAPGWVSFVNQRRANTAQNQVLQEYRMLQADAQRTRRTQILGLISEADSASGLPELETHGVRQVIGPEDLKPGMLSLRAVTSDGTTLDQLSFQPNGTLALTDETLLPIKITLASPASSSTQRCVVIETLLGGVHSEKDSACD